MKEIIRSKLNSIINKKIVLSKPLEEIGESEDLTEYGLNSISAIRLIIAIEEEFGFKVNDEDLTIDKFNTISNISSYIQSKVKCVSGDSSLKSGISVQE
jgi:acyl carrier protein